MSQIALLSLFLLPIQQSYELRRYMRPAGDKFVLESEILIKKTPTGSHYQSTTHRGAVQMRLMITFDKNRNPKSAEIRLKNKNGTQFIQAEFEKSQIVVKTKDKVVKTIPIKKQPVLATTAPDWSDIILLMQRYDHKQGGKQEFAGLWFHPVNPSRILTFTVERKKAASIKTVKGKIALSHFIVRLRSGQYNVWADADGLVYRLSPAGRPKAAVILIGHEKTTKDLTP